MIDFIIEREMVNGSYKYGIVAYENEEFLSSIHFKKNKNNKFLFFIHSAKRLFAGLLNDNVTKQRYEIAVETLKQQYEADNN